MEKVNILFIIMSDVIYLLTNVILGHSKCTRVKEDAAKSLFYFLL